MSHAEARRVALRVVSLAAIALGYWLADAKPLSAGPPQCAHDPTTMCVTPPNYVICSAACTENPAGYLLDCNLSAYNCLDE